MRLILLGLPGVGKGTQAKILAQRQGLLHISTGDMFREAAAAGTELGKKAQEFMSAGALVPDEVTIGMLLERIAKPDAAKGLMLDGFPRTIPQAEALDKALAKPGYELTVDLETCEVSDADGLRFPFVVHGNPATHEFRRYTLMNGLDSIALTLQHEDAITAFEATRPDFLPRVGA